MAAMIAARKRRRAIVLAEVDQAFEAWLQVANPMPCSPTKAMKAAFYAGLTFARIALVDGPERAMALLTKVDP